MEVGGLGGGLDAPIAQRGRPRQRRDEQAQRCGHDPGGSSEYPPASRHRIKCRQADKQFSGWVSRVRGRRKYPTRAGPLFLLLVLRLRRPGGLDGHTFQIAGKAEPSRNRQRAAVDESRGT